MKLNIQRVVTGSLQENCYIISIKDECLIIDPGDEFYKIKQIIGNKKVLAVLITHYHFDHVGALDDVTKYYHVNVIDYKSDKYQNIGPFSFEVIETKGHKEDCVTYYFKNINTMFTGDFLFKESIGRCDLDGGNYIEMMKSLNKIKKYDENIIIFPGHGSSTVLKYELKNNLYLRGDAL